MRPWWSTTAWTSCRCSSAHHRSCCSWRRHCSTRRTWSSPAASACTRPNGHGIPTCTAFPAAWTSAISLRRRPAPACPRRARRPGSHPRPRLGFFGVIDERLDLGLLDVMAASHPEWQVVMVGPMVKIEPATLPRRPNIHYLGQRRTSGSRPISRAGTCACCPSPATTPPGSSAHQNPGVHGGRAADREHAHYGRGPCTATSSMWPTRRPPSSRLRARPGGHPSDRRRGQAPHGPPSP